MLMKFVYVQVLLNPATILLHVVVCRGLQVFRMVLKWIRQTHVVLSVTMTSNAREQRIFLEVTIVSLWPPGVV